MKLRVEVQKEFERVRHNLDCLRRTKQFIESAPEEGYSLPAALQRALEAVDAGIPELEQEEQRLLDC